MQNCDRNLPYKTELSWLVFSEIPNLGEAERRFQQRISITVHFIDAMATLLLCNIQDKGP